MANQWLRLWHDMPNDPKFRTIARASGQPVSAVLAVYIHLLVNASNATERGRTHGIASEDLASALDLDTDQIDQILTAMQGRVLDGDHLTGWKTRQPEREDGASERAKRWREAKKLEQQTQTNASERIQTLDKDKDKDKETTKADAALPVAKPTASPKGTRLPEDWQPTPELTAWAKGQRPDLNITQTVERFRDYWTAKPGKDGVKLKWDATFRNWVRNEKAGNPADVKQNVVRPLETRQAPETPEQRARRKADEQAAFEAHMRSLGVAS